MSPVNTDPWGERRSLIRRSHWPVLLSLLPAATLGILAWMSLQADRRWVENDARERAQAAVERTAAALTQTLNRDLEIYRSASTAGSAPGESGTQNPASAWTQFLQRFPDLTRSNLTPAYLRLTTNGALMDPRPYDPTPVAPRWFRNLSANDATAWRRLTDAFENYDTNDFSAIVAQARSTVVVPEMATLIDLVQATISRVGTPATAFDSLKALDYPTVITPGGLPWSAQYYANRRGFEIRHTHHIALRSGPERPFPDVSVLSNLVSRVPSALTPYFLKDARRLAWLVSEQQTLDQLTAVWDADERRRAVAAGWWHSEPALDGAPQWLAVEAENWLVSTRSDRADTNHPTVTMEILPEWILARILREELQIQSRALPAGLHHSVTLAGRPLTEDPRPPATSDRMATLSTFVTLDSAGGPPTRLEVTALLTDPAALFARTRQRQRLFGGLVGGSLLIAALGAWLSARAIRRQELLAEQRGNFVAAVSHELRAPIASIRLLAENLERGTVQSEDKRRDYYALISRETRRLSQLIANVLDFGRLERRQISYLPTPADLREVLQESTAVLRPLAAEREVTFHLTLPDASIATSLAADASALQRALVNLLDNALKHSPPGGVVNVTLRAVTTPSPGFEIAVADQGPGIPPADQHRIFEPFVRLGSELRRETPGVGLGLALARHIALGHGGSLEVESQLGAGATFRLRLPARVAH